MRIIQPLVGSFEKWCSRASFLGGLYGFFYRETLQKEIELAGINASDRVLNIGCGALPFTALYISLFTGAKVWALDVDREAVERARLYLEKVKVPGEVQVVEGEGSLYDPLDFSATVVALQAEPKEDILNNLLSRSLPGSRFVFRQPSSPYKKHYDSLPESFVPADQVCQNMKTFNRSLLFIKERN